MAFLVVGLGNPGLQYKLNRHNVGFMAVEKVAQKVGIEFSKKEFGGTCGFGLYDGNGKMIVFKPQTYMNNSGEPVRQIMRFHKIENRDMVVIHDEVDLPVGSIQVKLGGGSAGHNGIKSLIRNLGSDFARVRIGVGKPLVAGIETADHVLSDFKKDEAAQIEGSIKKAVDAVCEITSQGIETAMNKYNRN